MARCRQGRDKITHQAEYTERAAQLRITTHDGEALNAIHSFLRFQIQGPARSAVWRDSTSIAIRPLNWPASQIHAGQLQRFVVTSSLLRPLTSSSNRRAASVTRALNCNKGVESSGSDSMDGLPEEAQEKDRSA